MKDKPFATNIKPANAPKQRQEKRPPKKITESYLHNAGLYYLQRFAASREHFRQVMIRKVKKSCMHHKDQDYEACLTIIDALVETFSSVGLLDDTLYTRGVVNSMRRQGKSKKAILAKLRARGLDEELIANTLETHAQEYDTTDAELRAALIFARKKRIGPYQNKDKQDEHTQRKSLGSLARAGFSYDTARSVFEIDISEAEKITRQA